MFILTACVALFTALEINRHEHVNHYDMIYPIILTLFFDMCGLTTSRVLIGGTYVLLLLAYAFLWINKLTS